ncbi:MAG TPA: hypothetical protein VJA44_05050 [Acidimicrobiia bacterium]|nr:hypothetical protein [Acidimicrobiia bacterium]
MTNLEKESRWVSRLERGARVLVGGAIAGGIAGLLWGGIGGRIAMRIIFLTSNPAFAGLQSDDDFTIGQISAASMFLVVVTTIGGAALGAMATVLRSLLRTGTAVAAGAFAVAAAAFFGGAIVHTDGIDFRLLDPLALTVGLFVFLPAAWAGTTIVLVDRFLRPGGWSSRIPGGLVVLVGGLTALVLVALGGALVRDPLSLVVLGVAGIGGLAVASVAIRKGEPATTARTAAHWAVWCILGALTVFGTIDLARDVAALT